jgi:hypothetical protein
MGWALFVMAIFVSGLAWRIDDIDKRLERIERTMKTLCTLLLLTGLAGCAGKPQPLPKPMGANWVDISSDGLPRFALVCYSGTVVAEVENYSSAKVWQATIYSDTFDRWLFTDQDMALRVAERRASKFDLCKEL